MAGLLQEGVGISVPTKPLLPQDPAIPYLERLSQTRSWQKLLFIPDGKILPFQSVINDPSFFFKKGESTTVDPLAELHASLNAFKQPLDPKNPNKHPQCLFPARFQWIQEQLGPLVVWPKPDCQDLENFLKIAAYDQVQMVFTNYYINNPASMFGHTFLKLKRKPDPASTTYHPLLDDAVNFAAAVDPNDRLIYPIKGLTGGYLGFFSLIPYHRKTQEYNNYESRDLWEYPLDLNQVEVQRLTLILWELGGKKTPYYYFTQNCSFILLSLLEAAAPRHKLTQGFLLFAIPADTLRSAVRAAGSGKPPEYRPSSMSRYQMRLAALNPEQVGLLRTLVITDADFSSVPLFTKSPWEICDDSCRLKIFDTALEFYEFEERLGGEYLPTTYAKVRQTVLEERAKIKKPSPLLLGPPTSTPPHLGHPSSVVEFRAGGMISHFGDAHQTKGGFSILRWRPAVQDFSDPSEGYNKGMELKFLDTTLRYQSQQSKTPLWLQDLTILSASSLPAQLPLVTSWGWNYSLGMERGFGTGGKYETETTTHRSYLQAGPGLAQAFLGESLWFYGFLNADLGFAHGVLHGGPLLVGGLIYESSFGLKLHSRFHVGKLFPINAQRLRALNTVSLGLNKTDSGVLTLDYWTHQWEASLGIRRYF